MRKMIMMAAAATATIALSAPATAQEVTAPDGTILTNTPEMAAGYSNRGAGPFCTRLDKGPSRE